MSSRCLLLVDADPTVHETLTGILKRADRGIQDVYDADEALECVRRTPCDLVIAGQGRNGDDPMELLRSVHHIRPQTPVILTGEPDSGRVLEAMRAHAYSYFHKPFPEGPVADMVQQALDSPSWQDDIRVLSACPPFISLEVRAKFEAVERTTHFVREIESCLPRPICEDVGAAFRELMMNAVEHGAKYDATKFVRVWLVRTRAALIVKILDPGAGFPMQGMRHAAICNPADDPTLHVEVRVESGQRPGGFGILMTRSLVDELIYSEHGNEVVFVKYL